MIDDLFSPIQIDFVLQERLAQFGFDVVRQAVGAGGSATVHQARVLRATGSLPPPGTPVAIKEFRPELLAVDGQLRRVRQEAELGASLQSPHVVKTYGLLPSSDDPHFLVMEWIQGATMTEWNQKTEFPTWETLRAIAVGLVDGLEALHNAGVLHRDIKPENVMIRDNGEAVIMDIGVAELTVDTAETLHTEVAQFLGSLRYASPQFLMGEKFGHADDIYGLGTVLFELFTGSRMFEGHERKTALPVLIAHEGQRVESLREGVPAPIKILLQAAIHRDRARRPKLVDIRDALSDPAGSRFISTELERQTAEERGFPVLKVLDSGMSFYADLGGADLSLGSEFTVVRRAEPLKVPSLSRTVTPEQWTGTARLKHIFQNVGHFVLTGKRWQEDREAISRRDPFGLGIGSGHLVECEQLAASVKIGDWVLKR